MANSARNSCLYVSLGTNLGNRILQLQHAVQLLQSRVGQIFETSFLYSTAPMYVVDQPSFLNAVVKMETKLSPIQVLETLKAIEKDVGRVPSIRYGPRSLDLDLLFYNDQVIHCETSEGPLRVPHERIAERSFVLQPLMDICPEYRHPKMPGSIAEMLHTLKDKEKHAESPVRVLPLNHSTLWKIDEKTCVMGIINATPDSFSDGGDNFSVEKACDTVEKMISAGCHMLDIGGATSQPGADPVSVDEELSRIIPIIRKLRERSITLPISVDTYQSAVARAAIEAGANLVNDISAGTADPQMLPTVAELGVPIVLMHMKGTPKTMQHLKDYQDVAIDVGRKLKEYVAAAQLAGIPKWNLLVDPGIGFAKGLPENLTVIRKLDQISDLCGKVPLLVGPSRKKFIGTLCNRPDPKDRDAGTVAACCASIAQGASIVRVHNVAPMVDAALMMDAIWKN